MAATNDLLISGGDVLDGTGVPARRADVRVRDGIIVEVGPGLHRDGEQRIDAAGALVTPGFIDVHTHLDPTLFWDRDADPVALHGVTTVLTGNCSLSVAPVRPEHIEAVSAVFSYIEDLPMEVFLDHIPWTWGRWAEYRAAHDFGMSVNSAELVGHTPLRMYVMSEAAWERAANDDERDEIAAVLDECLRYGAFGLSTSYFDDDEAGRPVPARLADDAELQALFDVLERHDALLQFVPEMRAAEPVGSIERMAWLCGDRRLRMTWTGLSYDPRLLPSRRRMLDRTLELQRRGLRITPQYSPRPGDTRVNWDRSMAFGSLPDGWGRYITARGEEKRRLLQDPDWRKISREEWDLAVASMFPVKRPEKIKFIGVNRPELKSWIGKSLFELTEARGGHPSDVLADWVLENDLYPEVMAVDRTNDDPDAVRRLLRHPAVLLGSSDAGAHVGMMCAAGDATLVLTRHVRERGDLELEEVIAQLTGGAAKLVGLADRGEVREGLVADLNVFALDELVWAKPDLVYDLPGGGVRFRRPPGQYRYTISAGSIVQEAGHPTAERPGRFLVHGSARA
jgi:N-acyl-D-aspartate/D-glutamate deacylase